MANTHENSSISMIIENGIQLCQRRGLTRRHHTGCAWLTEHLRGGFREGEITEIAGGCATGKTQLLLTFIATVVYETNGRALYIDTTGSFDPHRMSEIVLLRHEDFTEPVFEAFMHRILVVRVFSQLELMAVLDALNSNTNNILDDLKAVVVDHVTAILSPDVPTEAVAGYHRMMCAGRRLKTLAMQHNLVVVIATGTVDITGSDNDEDTDGESGMEEEDVAMGKWWSTVANTRLLLTKSDKSETQTIVKLVKSLTLPIGGSTEIEITEEGVTVAIPENPALDEELDNRPVSPFISSFRPSRRRRRSRHSLVSCTRI